MLSLIFLLRDKNFGKGLPIIKKFIYLPVQKMTMNIQLTTNWWWRFAFKSVT